VFILVAIIDIVLRLRWVCC